MRCRKVRSLLSVACSDELDIRRQAVVQDHLASCPSCRREATYYTSVRNALGEVPRKALSDDFNTRLLNRLAQERFHETRTKAYLPHRAPRFSSRVLVPLAVTTALALAAITSFYVPGANLSIGTSTSQNPGYMDDRYLTAQPTHNPNVSAGLGNNWTLRNQLARAERLDMISRELTNRYGFDNARLAGSITPMGEFSSVVPQMYVRQQPVFRVYRIGGGTTGRGDGQAY